MFDKYLLVINMYLILGDYSGFSSFKFHKRLVLAVTAVREVSQFIVKVSVELVINFDSEELDAMLLN